MPKPIFRDALPPPLTLSAVTVDVQGSIFLSRAHLLEGARRSSQLSFCT